MALVNSPATHIPHRQSTVPFSKDPSVWLSYSFVILPALFVLIFFATGAIDTDAAKW